MVFQIKSCLVSKLELQKKFAAGYGFCALGSFGENVRKHRQAAGLKGVQLAGLIGTTPPVVTKWEKNRGGLPETPTLLKLAKALRCSVDDLLDGVDADYDLIRRSSSVQSRAGGNPHAPDDSARILELERRVSEYESAIEEIQVAASRVLKVAIVGRKGRTADGTRPRRGKHHRKAG